MIPQNPQTDSCRLDPASNEEYVAITLAFTGREVARCIQAIEWYIESFAAKMEASGVGGEVERFEDLMYRIMGVPDENMKHHVASRARDLPGGEN